MYIDITEVELYKALNAPIVEIREFMSNLCVEGGEVLLSVLDVSGNALTVDA